MIKIPTFTVGTKCIHTGDNGGKEKMEDIFLSKEELTFRLFWIENTFRLYVMIAVPLLLVLMFKVIFELA